MSTKPTAIGALSLYVAVAVLAVTVGVWHLPATAHVHWYWGIVAKALALIGYTVHKAMNHAE